MSSAFGLILGTASLLLHLALMLVVATLTGPASVGARDGSSMPRSIASLFGSLSAPIRSLAALMRKEPVRAANGSPVMVLAPMVALAATIMAAILVPSFCTGMLSAPFADLPTILALLALARVAVLLAAFDAGIAGPGLAAVSVSVRSLMIVPACGLALFTFALVSGSTSLDAVLGGLRAGPNAAVLLAAASLGLAAIAAGADETGLSEQLSGPDLAVFRFQHALQRLVWLDLVTALLLPSSLAVAQSNPLYWLLGLLGWILRVGGGWFVLGQLRRFGGLGGRQARSLAGMATLLGLLAPLLLLVGRFGE
ncbi:MAG: hypothetical protein ACRYGI_12050 [Janthinobacterium lividum]